MQRAQSMLIWFLSFQGLVLFSCGQAEPADEFATETPNGYQVINVLSLRGMSAEEINKRFGTPIPRRWNPEGQNTSVEKEGLLGWKKVTFFFSHKNRLRALAFTPKKSHALEEGMRIIKENLNVDLARHDRIPAHKKIIFSEFRGDVSDVQINMSGSKCRSFFLSFGYE